MKPGDLLLPGKYLNQRGTTISGIILEVVDDLWGPSYKLLLSNGNVKWMDGNTVRDLWEVVESEIPPPPVVG